MRADGFGSRKSFAQVQMSEGQLQLNQNTKTTVSSSAGSVVTVQKRSVSAYWDEIISSEGYIKKTQSEAETGSSGCYSAQTGYSVVTELLHIRQDE